MRSILVAAVMVFTACGVGGNKSWHSTSQPLSCDNGQTAIYTNRFTPQSGGSGVATGADAAAGRINSDGPSGTPSGSPGALPPSGGGGSAPPSGGGGTPAPGGGGGTAPAEDPNEPLTAMVASCGVAQCAPGQVAVELAPAPQGGGAGSSVGISSDVAGGAPAPVDPPAPADPPAPTVKCAAPPPTCQPGFSPQYTGHDTWECTDCALVVTYGGIYGNYRRCVNAPTIVCPDGQVPTWSADQETWQCQPTCDNGMYDQHTIEGQLVCVPC
jgi:hypothetical protein